MSHPVSLIINAGGESRRMGQPKEYLPVPPHNHPLILHIIQRLQPLHFEQIIIVSNDPTLPEILNLHLNQLSTAIQIVPITVLADQYPAMGPLAGIATGLNALAQDAWGLCVACDMPLLNGLLCQYLLQLLPQSSINNSVDAIVPITSGRPQPLHAIYNHRCLSVIESTLQAGERRMTSFLSDSSIQVRWVDEAEMLPFDPELHSFWNANTPDDWAEALALLRNGH